MNEIILLVVFLAVGFFAGIFVGMLGIGGGVLFVPLLYILLPFTNIDQSNLTYLVLGTSVFTGSLASLSAGSRQLFLKNVNVKKAALLALGSVISSAIIPMFVVKVEPIYLKIILVIIISLTAAKMLFENKSEDVDVKTHHLNNYYLFIFGLIIGALAAFSGIAGGVLYVPILIYLYSTELKRAVGTSSVVGAFTMISSTIAYASQQPVGEIVSGQYGYIYLNAGLPLGVGSAFGALFGIKLVTNSSAKTIKKIFAALLFLVVLKIILDI